MITLFIGLLRLSFYIVYWPVKIEFLLHMFCIQWQYLFILGISRSARGYCIILVLETMKTYSGEDGLTEEAVVTKLRTCRYHHLFLHMSLRQNSSGLQSLSFVFLSPPFYFNRRPHCGAQIWISNMNDLTGHIFIDFHELKEKFYFMNYKTYDVVWDWMLGSKKPTRE